MGESLRQAAEPSSKDTYLGDSWFGSVLACVQMSKLLQYHFIEVVETNYVKKLCEVFKAILIDKMLIGQLELMCNNVDLLVIDYKYNSRSVHCFVATKSVGHTEERVNYLAK